MTENFRRISLESAPRTELHDALGLTGCEVSVNALPAGADQGIRFVCIQTKAGSLEGFTNDDGVACDEKAPWL